MLGPWQIPPVPESQLSVRFESTKVPLILLLVVPELAEIRLRILEVHISSQGRDEWQVRIQRQNLPDREPPEEDIRVWVGGRARATTSVRQLLEGGRALELAIEPPRKKPWLFFEWWSNGWKTAELELPVRLSRPGDTP